MGSLAEFMRFHMRSQITAKQSVLFSARHDFDGIFEACKNMPLYCSARHDFGGIFEARKNMPGVLVRNEGILKS